MVLEQQFTTAAGAVLTPLLVSLRSAQQDQLVNRYVERAIPQLMLIAATLAGLAVPFVGIVVPAVFGQESGGASEPFAILLFALLLALAANLLLPSILLEERTTPIATVNVVAVVVNVVGDIVLVGFEHQPLIGPAIATSAATATIVIGYVGILRDHTSARPTLPIVPLVPFVAGFIPAVTLTHALAIPTSIAATAVCAAIVMVCAKPFEHEDVKLISQLDMPLALKRLTVRTLELTAR